MKDLSLLFFSENLTLKSLKTLTKQKHCLDWADVSLIALPGDGNGNQLIQEQKIGFPRQYYFLFWSLGMCKDQPGFPL